MDEDFSFVSSSVLSLNRCELRAKVKHSEKHCPNTKSNMKKLIGNSGLIRKEIRFYDLAFTGLKESACGSRNVGNPLQQQSSTSYKKLSLCPHMLSCQTFSEWKFQTSINRINRMFAARSIKSPPLTIYFIPVGPFPPFIYEYRSRSGLMLFDLICKFLSRYFTGCEVRTLPECEIQDKCVKNRIHCVTKKQQYYVADVLKFLQKKLPKDGYAIVGLSWHDLYPCETLNFVLGQGSSQYSTCVSSFGRFDPTYVKGFKGNKDGIAAEDMEDITEINDSLLWKLFKIISHETCHVFSIMHCSVFECLMNSSSSSKEALSQPLTLCPLCMSKLNYLLSTYRRSPNPAPPTIRKYFSSLLEFFQSVFGNTEDVQLSGVRNCMEWLKEMIVYLL